MAEYLGTKKYPYTHAPPKFSNEGVPWGAWCRCSRCGREGPSTNVFDFYATNQETPGSPLQCGVCAGIETEGDLQAAIEMAANNPDMHDKLGPGCRGGAWEPLIKDETVFKDTGCTVVWPPQSHRRFFDNLMMPPGIPSVKPFPDDSVQCDNCGGHGCPNCEAKGWLTPASHPGGRKCSNPGCRKPLKPDHYAVYCSNECALEDA